MNEAKKMEFVEVSLDRLEVIIKYLLKKTDDYENTLKLYAMPEDNNFPGPELAREVLKKYEGKAP